MAIVQPPGVLPPHCPVHHRNPLLSGSGRPARALPHKALVCDDLPVNRLILGTILHKLGFEVLEAENGLQCIDVYTQERSDLVCVFLDLQMPVADGWAATKGIRQLESQTPESESVPVVVCTASCLDDVVEGGETVAQRALTLGANGAVRKPLTTNAVQQILDEYAPKWRSSFDNSPPSTAAPRAAAAAAVAAAATALKAAAAAAVTGLVPSTLPVAPPLSSSHTHAHLRLSPYLTHHAHHPPSSTQQRQHQQHQQHGVDRTHSQHQHSQQPHSHRASSHPMGPPLPTPWLAPGASEFFSGIASTPASCCSPSSRSLPGLAAVSAERLNPFVYTSPSSCRDDRLQQQLARAGYSRGDLSHGPPRCERDLADRLPAQRRMSCDVAAWSMQPGSSSGVNSGGMAVTAAAQC